jgi:putative transcriptional regulator
MDYQSVEQGSLLITHPGYEERTFQRTVILVIDHSEQGTHGLILNRAGDQPLIENLRNPPENWNPTEPFYQGGPVFKHNVFMLHSPDWKIDTSTWVTDDLCITTGADAVNFISDHHQPMYWRMFLGSSVWGPGQLEMEFNRGDHQPQYGWLTAGYPSAAWIFEQDPEVLYNSALSLSTHQAVQSWI